MKYLVIENLGEAPILALTILGASVGKDDRIGLFGSGFSHSITYLLKNKIPFKIFSGKDEVEFYTETNFIHHKPIEVVHYRYQGEEQSTGFCLEFGQHDWDNLGMILREIISNALDQSSNVEDVVIKIQEPEGRENKTRFFIEYNDDVAKYFKNLDAYFTHFGEHAGKTLIPANTKDRGPRIYRKGVFIRELPNPRNYMVKYDYNLDNLKIDECRNSNESDCYEAIASYIENNENMMVEFLCLLPEHKKDTGRIYYEHDLGGYFDYKNHSNAWDKALGNAVLVTCPTQYNNCIENNLTPVYSCGWTFLKYCSIRVYEKVKQSYKNDGYKLITSEATEYDRLTYNKIWNELVKMEFTRQKDQPKLEIYDGIGDGIEHRKSEYKDGVIYIHKDHINNFGIIIRNYILYITDSNASDVVFDFVCEMMVEYIK